MSNSRDNGPGRRDFLGRLGAAAALLAGSGAVQLDAQPLPNREEEMIAGSGRSQLVGPPWDMSWVDRLANVPYRMVFDANAISDGLAIDLAAGIMDQFREAYGVTDDRQVRSVIIIRQLAAAMAMGDALWDKYAVGEELKTNDPVTQKPARRNVYWTAAPGSYEDTHGMSLSALEARGAIFLVCNIAAGNWARRHAEATHQDVDVVKAEVKAGLIPGAILMPSGVFALVRAQNAGCAYMRGG